MQRLSADMMGYADDDFPEDPPEERDDSDEVSVIREEGKAAHEVAVAESSLKGASVSAEAPGLERLRSIREIIQDLSKPISPRHIRQRQQGKSTLSYIDWHTAVRYLDYYSPGWFFEVRSMEVVRATDGSKALDRLVMTVRISIPAAEGVIWREATGFEFLNCDSFGDPSSNSEAMALKRAAAKFGVALHLYDK